jgi:hypothetical protein
LTQITEATISSFHIGRGEARNIAPDSRYHHGSQDVKHRLRRERLMAKHDLSKLCSTEERGTSAPCSTDKMLKGLNVAAEGNEVIGCLLFPSLMPRFFRATLAHVRSESAASINTSED